jgi:hypothetical protein
MQAPGGQPQDRAHGSQNHEHKVNDDLITVEVGESILESQGQEKSCDDLGAGLRDAELLKGVVPVAVEALSSGFVSNIGGIHIRCLSHEQMPALVSVPTLCSIGLLIGGKLLELSSAGFDR